MTLKVSTIREVNTMGYRSEVAYAIQVDRQQREPVPDKSGVWFLFLSEARVNPDTQMAMSMIDNDGKHFEGDTFWEGGLDSENESIYLRLSDVKWYDSYPEVVSLNALMDLAEKYHVAHDCISGSYVRIGEDSDDVEERHFTADASLLRTWCDFDAEEVRYKANNKKGEK
tara:strand:- start:365 stop:874 length:510 start_codon:yes stop_codon:yes gene_type:complete